MRADKTFRPPAFPPLSGILERLRRSNYGDDGHNDNNYENPMFGGTPVTSTATSPPGRVS